MEVLLGLLERLEWLGLLRRLECLGLLEKLEWLGRLGSAERPGLAGLLARLIEPALPKPEESQTGRGGWAWPPAVLTGRLAGLRWCVSSTPLPRTRAWCKTLGPGTQGSARRPAPLQGSRCLIFGGGLCLRRLHSQARLLWFRRQGGRPCPHGISRFQPVLFLALFSRHRPLFRLCR